ncbi:MAG: FliM/FliN family flagellar motor switch protein [Paracoccaceae bacterium]
MNDILRRKMARAVQAGAEGGPGADQGWRLAFARAARDCTGLMVEVSGMTVQRRSLAELLELPPERGLLALLDGPQGGLGLIVLSPEVLGALIEMQTTARVSAVAPLQRRPTRTDAAMVAPVVDRALEELDSLLAEEADLVWAGGFRYASFLEDPRPLGLLLEDHPYRVLTAQLSLAAGARSGSLILALPAEGRGLRPALKSGASDGVQPGASHSFAEAISEAVMSADCTLQAVLGRLTLPLSAVMTLKVDQVLQLPNAALERIGLEGGDGTRVAMAQLGQQTGMRAVRLSGGAAKVAARGAPSAGPPQGHAPAVPPTSLVPAGDPYGASAPLAPGADPLAGFGAPLGLGDGLLAVG